MAQYTVDPRLRELMEVHLSNAASLDSAFIVPERHQGANLAVWAHMDILETLPGLAAWFRPVKEVEEEVFTPRYETIYYQADVPEQYSLGAVCTLLMFLYTDSLPGRDGASTFRVNYGNFVFSSILEDPSLLRPVDLDMEKAPLAKTNWKELHNLAFDVDFHDLLQRCQDHVMEVVTRTPQHAPAYLFGLGPKDPAMRDRLIRFIAGLHGDSALSSDPFAGFLDRSEHHNYLEALRNMIVKAEPAI